MLEKFCSSAWQGQPLVASSSLLAVSRFSPAYMTITISWSQDGGANGELTLEDGATGADVQAALEDEHCAAVVTPDMPIALRPIAFLPMTRQLSSARSTAASSEWRLRLPAPAAPAQPAIEVRIYPADSVGTPEAAPAHAARWLTQPFTCGSLTTFLSTFGGVDPNRCKIYVGDVAPTAPGARELMSCLRAW